MSQRSLCDDVCVHAAAAAKYSSKWQEMAGIATTASAVRHWSVALQQISPLATLQVKLSVDLPNSCYNPYTCYWCRNLVSGPSPNLAKENPIVTVMRSLFSGKELEHEPLLLLEAYASVM